MGNAGSQTSSVLGVPAMAQFVGSGLSRLAMRVGAALGVAGIALVVLIPMGTPQAFALGVPDVYVTSQITNVVSIINTSTNTIAKTVEVGSGPAGIAVTPNSANVYVANGNSNTVSVIETSPILW